jgi:hypothetical protein
MILKLSYLKKEEIPSGFDSLYTEKDGKWNFSGVEGMKTTEDITRITSALDLEKKQHSETKKKWEAVTAMGIGAEEVVKSLETLEELKIKVEAGAGKEFDEGKFNEAVLKRVEREQVKWERERKALTERAVAAETNVGDLNGKINSGKIKSKVMEVCGKLEVKPSAFSDALLLAERVMYVTEDGQILVKDKCGYPPGLPMEEFMADRKTDKQHWWEGSVGGGSKTPNGLPQGVNPFAAGTRNLGQQGKLFKANPIEAARLAAEAGVKLHQP